MKNFLHSQHVFGQSGVQGFYGEGDEYPHHRIYKHIPGFSFFGSVFVAKTVTLYPRIYPENSNTELTQGYKIKRWFPNSIWVSIRSFLMGYLLNAVGLANEGARAVLARRKWQQRRDFFQISFMPMESTLSLKVRETQDFCDLLVKFMPPQMFPNYAIQVNLSCPNTGHGQTQDPAEAIAILSVFKEKIPSVIIIPKFDLLVEPETIMAIKPYCDAFMISNTLAFGKKSEQVNWKNLFRNGQSPLLKFFGGKFSGGLSGAPLFPVLVAWLQRMQQHDPTVSIIAGGGIMTNDDINILSEFKIVKGVALGSVAILRPWRIQGLIDYGNKIFSQRKLDY